MSAGVDTPSRLSDGLKWAVVTALVVGGVTAFYYYGDQSLLLRVIALLVVMGAALFIAVQTEKGRATWSFVRDSRTEVRRVVWPTRRETLQTTGIIFVVVTIMALFLWILDQALGMLIRLLLSQGGGG